MRLKRVANGGSSAATVAVIHETTITRMMMCDPAVDVAIIRIPSGVEDSLGHVKTGQNRYTGKDTMATTSAVLLRGT